MAQFGPPFFCQ